MLVALAPSCTTLPGALHIPLPPLPVSPEELFPQHQTAPLVSSAQPGERPAWIVFTVPDRPLTSTGTWLGSVVPSPSWPASLLPQHQTAPASVTPHVKESPAAMRTMP